MPKHYTAEFQDGRLVVEPVCVGCAGFVPDGYSRRSGGKAPKRMWAPIPRVEPLPISAGARPSNPPPVVDRHGRMFGGEWHTVKAAARINRAVKNSPDLSEASTPSAQGFFGDEWNV